jgi:glycosyltransferase involved in cell wall biosynthesis
MIIIQSPEFVVQPLVSVIIPSYNRADTVGQTIDSILNQRCNFEFELIIGDDCSTDRAREVLKEYQAKYPEKIRLLFHEQNIGLGANWATCVKECRGKYLANCDNDDYWHNPEKLQLQVDFLETHPDENVLITNHRTHHRDTGVITEEEAYIDRSIPLQQAFFKGRERFCNATILYRKDFLVEHLNLDDFIKYQFTLQDWNTWIILSAYTDFHILPVSTATFGVETESITRPKSYASIINRFTKEKECYKYVCNLFPEDLPFDENGYDVYVNGILLGLAYKKMDYRNAHKYGSVMKSQGSNSLKVRCTQNRIPFYAFWLLQKLKSLITNR